MNNLKAEMKRYGVSIFDLSKAIDATEKTVRNKLDGETTFTIKEAFTIRDEFFSGMRLEYLFAQADSAANRPNA